PPYTSTKSSGRVPPVTRTGEVRSINVPSPTAPTLLSPQAWTSPFLIANVWLYPAETAVTPEENPGTTMGAGLEMKFPCPSSPSIFSPQTNAPPFFRAIVCPPPTLKLVTPLAMFNTACGVVKKEPDVLLPIPRYPFVLLFPQANSAPLRSAIV